MGLSEIPYIPIEILWNSHKFPSDSMGLNMEVGQSQLKIPLSQWENHRPIDSARKLEHPI